MNSPSMASRILPSGPVRPSQNAKVTFWVGMLISPPAAGLAAPWAAGAVVAAGAAAGAAGLLSAGLAGALVAAGALPDPPPLHAARSPPATAVVASPKSFKNRRRSIATVLVAMASL